MLTKVFKTVDEYNALILSRPGFDSHFRCGSVSRWGHTGDLKFGTGVLQQLPCHAPAVIGLALGLVGPRVSILWLGDTENLICKLLSQCGSTYNCLSSYVPQILKRVAGTLNNQQPATTALDMWPCFCRLSGTLPKPVPECVETPIKTQVELHTNARAHTHTHTHIHVRHTHLHAHAHAHTNTFKYRCLAYHLHWLVVAQSCL